MPKMRNCIFLPILIIASGSAQEPKDDLDCVLVSNEKFELADNRSKDYYNEISNQKNTLKILRNILCNLNCKRCCKDEYCKNMIEMLKKLTGVFYIPQSSTARQLRRDFKFRPLSEAILSGVKFIGSKVVKAKNGVKKVVTKTAKKIAVAPKLGSKVSKDLLDKEFKTKYIITKGIKGVKKINASIKKMKKIKWIKNNRQKKKQRKKQKKKQKRKKRKTKMSDESEDNDDSNDSSDNDDNRNNDDSSDSHDSNVSSESEDSSDSDDSSDSYDSSHFSYIDYWF